MPQKIEKVPDDAHAASIENLERAVSVESADAFEAVDHQKSRERSRESELSSAERVRERLLAGDTSMVPPTAAKATAYLEKNLPERFRGQQFFAGAHQKVSKMIFSAFEALGLFKIQGREHVPPSGECIIVSNHTRFFDESKLFALLSRPAHILGADMHFDMSPFHNWFMKAIGAIPVRSTLQNLSAEEKTELVKRAPRGARAYYRKVVNRDDEPMSAEAMRAHRETLQSTVAVLLKGEPVILFPEGLWLYEGGKMRKAYGGIEHIAREYHRLTGKDLPIVPVGITKGSATAGKPVILSKGQNVHDVMKKVAELLPDNERGYYSQKV